jgi:hypothetical protein
MNWKARTSAGPYVLLGTMALAWCIVAVARGDQAPVCDPRPVESNLPGAPCAVTEADRLRDQLRRERINHRLELRAALVTNRNLRRILYTKPSVQEAVTIASLVSGVDRGHLWTVIRCESGGNPLVTNRSGSDAGGLVQYLGSTWRATTFGKAGLSRYSAYANAIQGALAMRHSMSPWAASRHCWGGR